MISRKRAIKAPSQAPRREKQTLIPSFDAKELAEEVESTLACPTARPPFDPHSYARIVEAHVGHAADANAALRGREGDGGEDSGVLGPEEPTLDAPLDDGDALSRAMYGSYLASNFPEALVLAERVLLHQPEHGLAQLVHDRCRTLLAPSETPAGLSPSSVVRLRSAPEELDDLDLDPASAFVLGHVDGISDADTIAGLSGIPRGETLHRLHALIDLGVVELVSA